MNQTKGVEYDETNNRNKDFGLHHTSAKSTDESTNANHGPKHRVNIHQYFDEEIMNDYTYLLVDFLSELDDGESHLDGRGGESAMIYKADVLFFAKELQWRFEELREQWKNMKDFIEKESKSKSSCNRAYPKNSSNETDTSKTDKSEQKNIKSVNDTIKQPQSNKMSRSTQSSLQQSENGKYETKEYVEETGIKEQTQDDEKTTPILSNDEILELQKQSSEKNAKIQSLEMSLKSLQEEFTQAQDTTETQRLQLLHTQSRLKYLELAFQTSIAKHPQNNNGSYVSGKNTSFSPIVDAIAHVSVLNESEEKSSHIFQTENEFDSPIVEEMRKQIVELANALEKSEKAKVDLYEQSIKEKHENAKLIQMLGQNVRNLMNSPYPPPIPDGYHDLD